MEKINDERWAESANCATTDPEVMFLEVGGAGIKVARAVCARCLVTEDCLADAINTEDFDGGVRAGMTGRERKKYAQNIEESRTGAV